MFEQNPLDRIEQIDAMRMGVDYRLAIRIRNYSLSVRPLTISESLQVTSTVNHEIGRLPLDQQNRMTEHFLLAKETLKIASTSDVDRNDPKITDLILTKMTNDEIHFMFKQYVAACDRVNPALELLSAEEIETLVEGIKKNKKDDLVYQLTELSFSQLVSMVHHSLTKGD